MTAPVLVWHAFSGKGPVHLDRADSPGLSWCGAKSQFRHVTRPGKRDEVTCTKCLRAMAANQPKAWRA